MDSVVNADRLALGTVQWGLPYGIANRTGRPDDAEITRILATAREAGVRVLDTARAYGESEAVIGRLVGPDPWWTVVTKLPPLDAPTADGAELVREAAAHLDMSRATLRRDTLDIVLLHAPTDRLRSDGAVWRELLRQRDAGTIGALGISARSPEEALDALGDADVTAMQVAFSVLDARLTRAGFFRRADEHGVRLFLRSTYLQGVAHLELADLPLHLRPLAPTLAAIESWASAHSLSRAQAFLLFAREARPDTLVLGCETVAQVEDNLRTLSIGAVDGIAEALSAVVPDLPESIVNPARWPAS